ncbi:hypothetical protein EfmE980_2555 [Enterococcus faecium E980]|uniref:hypothetical protein n=1 Tax=Enterococcus faecium TaxID=1352 RepID=UPI0001CEAF53|nr:hypothetical protein [Enterococcus faecium]EFF36465.1 hypothetical protein EfmE980_2555 [Enterococcus faecium E980]EGP5461649.1 hypothetical protein [Enterococcus faecium]EME8164258.1 hypothetical protein [Enterococcus faecium]MBD9743336.1 hypothetical protein [Enterococcus faecium]MBD9755335.1 hypothetical protein [Enterococcus faecium]
MKPIKVIAIPDKTRIIINVGYQSNLEEYGYPYATVDVDDKIIIFEKGKDIIDPDTNESLGSYDPIKAILSITEVKEKFSIAQMKKNDSLSFAQLISPMTKNKEPIYDELPVNEEDISNIVIQSPEIRIGDLVRFDFDDE